MTRSAVIERYRSERLARANDPLRIADEWFAEQRAFYDSQARLLAVIKGRRAGGTRGLAGHYTRQALTIPGSQLLYINSTLDECRRLFWTGLQQDGVYSLAQRYKINVEPDRTRLTLHFLDTDSWIYCRGAKDETELAKALGSAYTEVTWDEAQKIRPTMSMTIREVLMPTLLDFGGRLRYVGTANRQQSGVFWDITQPDHKKRTGGWEVHHWNMLANPHFGRAVWEAGQWWVYALKKTEAVSGPHTKETVDAAVAAARMKFGIEQLARDLDVPVDSPIIQREGFGIWTPEDSAYVYHIRKARDPYYAPARLREDGFPDIMACLADLPGDWQDYTFSMGGDLGFRDAFALHCWAWSPFDPVLYEVFSWKKSGLDSDQQFNAIKEVREILPLGQVVVDAGGIGLSVSTAWSKVFVERYNLPIEPAEKHQKESFQALYNTDIANGRVKFREGGETADEMMQLQWSKLVTGTGKQIEDPTQDNHACFVAGTLVETAIGPRAIESIVAGDMVWTRAGLRRVRESGATGTRETHILTTENGQVIEATANHPIYTQNGFIRLDELMPGSTLCAWGSTDLRKQSSISDTTSDGIRRARIDRTPGTFSARSKVSPCSFIEQSGNTSADRFQSDFMSITSTKTPAIIRSIISNAFKAAIIFASTWLSRAGLNRPRPTLSSMQSLPQWHGTSQARVAPGTASTQPRSWRIVRSSISSALSAMDRFAASFVRPRFAAIGAMPSEDETVESMTSTSRATSALSFSGETDIRSRPFALDHVQSVASSGRVANVYNLSVEGEPEYFANGILVHNCDGSLYSHRSSYAYRSRPEDIPPQPGSRAAMQRIADELEDENDEQFDQPWRRRGMA